MAQEDLTPGYVEAESGSVLFTEDGRRLEADSPLRIFGTFKGDGEWGKMRQTGGDIVHRPFLESGNRSNYMIERVFTGELDGFDTPPINSEAGTNEGGGGLNGDTLYMIDETPLEPSLAAKGHAKVSRFYAPEWPSFFEYSDVSMSLPDLRGLSFDPGTGTVTPTSNDGGRSLVMDINVKTVASETLFFTSGSFTFTNPFNGVESDPINYDDFRETMENKINATLTGNENYALNEVFAGTASPNIITIIFFSGFDADFANFPKKTNFDLNNLEPEANIMNEITDAANGTFKDFFIFLKTGEIEVTSHGVADGEKRFIKDNDLQFAKEVVMSVVDSDNLTFENTKEIAANTERDESLDQIAEGGFYFIRTKSVSARMEHRFYMPGVTEGIETPADIPKPKSVDHDRAMLIALAKTQERFIVDVSKLAHPYPGVYERVITTVKREDVFD